jgi:hypothetical protein
MPRVSKKRRLPQHRFQSRAQRTTYNLLSWLMKCSMSRSYLLALNLLWLVHTVPTQHDTPGRTKIFHEGFLIP